MNLQARPLPMELHFSALDKSILSALTTCLIYTAKLTLMKCLWLQNLNFPECAPPLIVSWPLIIPVPPHMSWFNVIFNTVLAYLCSLSSSLVKSSLSYASCKMTRGFITPERQRFHILLFYPLCVTRKTTA